MASAQNKKSLSGRWLAGLLVLAVLCLAALVYSYRHYYPSKSNLSDGQINSYQECVDSGNPVLQSAIEACQMPDGRLFVNGE